MGDHDAQIVLNNPRFQLITPIGRGGMAELLLVMMQGAGGIGKLVVLKRIWPELAADPHISTMFLDEARLAVRMTHPNVVQTYEVFDDEGRVTLAMEYLDGQPLGRILNRMRGSLGLSLPLRLRLVAQVLAGLHYAHELRDYDGTPLSVVHRDVSPPNVFVTYEGGVKLIDFGIAKNLASAHQTRPGIFKGRFAYVAPEQFLGRPVDRRTDLFSVGIMLWEMLAGRRFWGAATDAEIAARLISNQPLPALPADPALPAGLAGICARALELEASQRYGTAAEMEADVQRALASIAEPDDRLLGKAVASAFAGDLAQRQATIDQYVRRTRSGGAYPTPSSGSLPQPVVPPTRRPVFRPLPAVAMAGTVAVLLVLLMASLFHRGAPEEASTGPIAAPPRPPAAASAGEPGNLDRLYLREPSALSPPPAAAPLAAAAGTVRRRRSRTTTASSAAAAGAGTSSAALPTPESPRRPESPWTGPSRPPRPIDTINPFVSPPPDAGSPAPGS